MKGTRFDDLTRSLAGGTSRRDVLKLLTAGLASGLLVQSKNASVASAAPKSSVAIQARGASSISTLNTTSVGGRRGLSVEQSESLRTLEVLPYRAMEYRFKVIPPHHMPPRGFEREDFDDFDFKDGGAAFGSRGTLCSLQGRVSSLWPLQSRLIVRRFISILPGTAAVRIMISVDNDIVELFFNGELIASNVIHEGCPVEDEFQFDVPISLVQKANKRPPGMMSLIAAHVRDRGTRAGGINESFFDMRVEVDAPETTPEQIERQVASIADAMLPLVPLADIKLACLPDETRLSCVIERTRQTAEIRMRRDPENIQARNITYLIDGRVLFTSLLTRTPTELSVEFGPGDVSMDVQNLREVTLAYESLIRHSSVQNAVARCTVFQQTQSILSSGQNSTLQLSDETGLRACEDVMLDRFALCQVGNLMPTDRGINAKSPIMSFLKGGTTMAMNICEKKVEIEFERCKRCIDAGCNANICAGTILDFDSPQCFNIGTIDIIVTCDSTISCCIDDPPNPLPCSTRPPSD